MNIRTETVIVSPAIPAVAAVPAVTRRDVVVTLTQEEAAALAVVLNSAPVRSAIRKTFEVDTPFYSYFQEEGFNTSKELLKFHQNLYSGLSCLPAALR